MDFLHSDPAARPPVGALGPPRASAGRRQRHPLARGRYTSVDAGASDSWIDVRTARSAVMMRRSVARRSPLPITLSTLAVGQTDGDMTRVCFGGDLVRSGDRSSNDVTEDMLRGSSKDICTDDRWPRGADVRKAASTISRSGTTRVTAASALPHVDGDRAERQGAAAPYYFLLRAPARQGGVRLRPGVCGPRRLEFFVAPVVVSVRIGRRVEAVGAVLVEGVERRRPRPVGAGAGVLDYWFRCYHGRHLDLVVEAHGCFWLPGCLLRLTRQPCECFLPR